MNYYKIYTQLINKRKENLFKGYSEKHHIVPRSLGGTDDKCNIVLLTAREHFIAHLLLSKIYPEGSISWVKMQKALINMYSVCIYHKRYTPSRWYEYCRKRLSRANSLNQTGEGNSQYNKVWVHNKKLCISKFIHKNELSLFISEGWELGRIIKWDKDNTKTELAHKIKERKLKESINVYTKYYQIYNEYGWEKFVKITGYNKSKPNLVTRFKKYVKEFKPQNGKKRGK